MTASGLPAVGIAWPVQQPLLWPARKVRKPFELM